MKPRIYELKHTAGWSSVVKQYSSAVCTDVTADFAPFVVKWYIDVKHGKDLLELLAGLHTAWHSQHHCNSLNQIIKTPKPPTKCSS